MADHPRGVRRALAPFVLYAAIALLPAVLTLVLLRVMFDAAPARFVPAAGTGTMTDQIVYWSEIEAARTVGLNTGYFNFDETPARLALSRFGGHGAVYPLLMAALSHITGWQGAGPVVLNMALLAGGWLYLLCVLRPAGWSLAAAALLAVTFWPMLLFLPSAMAESLNLAGALVVGAGLALHLRDGRSPRVVIVVTLVALIALSLMRLTWALLMLPYLVLVLPRRRRGWAVLTSAGLLAAASLHFLLFFAPYYDAPVTVFLRELRRIPTLSYAAELLATQFLRNTAYMLTGSWLVVSLRVSVLVLMLVAILAVLARRGVFRQSALRRLSWTLPEAALHSTLLISIVLAHLIAYTVLDFVDYRGMSHALLISLILLLAMERRRVLGLWLAVNLLALPSFVEIYRAFNEDSFRLSPQRWADMRAALAPHIAYDPAADPWCNTVLTNLLVPELTALPAGIGYSLTLWDKPLPAHPRSHWLLLERGSLPALAEKARVPMIDAEWLAETPVGTLYRNRQADCAG